jgi:hypothetical protein
VDTPTASRRRTGILPDTRSRQEVVVRPAVHPALARLRRDPATVQVGTDPGPAVVLGGLQPVVADVLLGLDGRRPLSDLRRTVERRGGDPAALDAALAELDRAGVLVDRRLPPERVAEALTAGPSAAGSAGRRLAGAWVEVRGADRVGAAVASLLAAVGTGLVTVDDRRVTEPGEPCPGGLAAEDVGRRRGPAAERAAHLAGRRGHAPARRRTRPDLVVLAPGAAGPRNTAATLQAEGVPHLVVTAGATAGTVGPLVLPGSSSCLRCHDLHRADRDPAWVRLAQQTDQATPAGICPVPLAWSLAALAAQHTAVRLGGGEPPTVDGTLDVALPDLLPRRRSWRQHPSCGCAWCG